ncbi:MAG: phosphohydrolase, partial [Ferruginibacter sp.]
ASHPDTVLSYLSQGILNRNLLKVKYFNEPVEESLLQKMLQTASRKLNLSAEEASWLVFTGLASSSTYNFENEHIQILFKDGSVKDISEVDHALINENLRGKVEKYYICFIR